MKIPRHLWMSFLVISLSAVAFAQTGRDPRLVTRGPDAKAERARLTEEMLAQKAAGRVPDAALQAAFDALAPRPAAGALDQGNDACPATIIPSVPFTDNGSTSGRVNNFTSCGGNASPDVIYQFTPAQSGTYTIQTCGSSYDTRLEVRHGGSCPGTTQDRCNDDSCGTSSIIVMPLLAGTTYFIIVDGYLNVTHAGSYTLNVAAAAEGTGETCASPKFLTVPGTMSGSTCGSTDDYYVACPYNEPASAPDMVYAYTPATSQSVTFSLCTGTTNFDTKLYLYAGSCGGTPLSCNDDACQPPLMSVAYASRLECVALTANTTYYLVVDGYGGACGNYTLTTTVCGGTGPANDNCQNVTPLPLPITAGGNNTGATHDCGILDPGEGEVWHAFTLDYTADVEVKVCGQAGLWGVFFNVLTLGCPCDNDISATTSVWDDNCTHGGLTLVWEDLPAGTYYYPVIYHTYNLSVGAYTITIRALTPPPPLCELTEQVTFRGTAAQAACASLCPTTPTVLVVSPAAGEGPLPANRPPVLTVALGCNTAGLCDNTACSAAASFVYEPSQWMWFEGSWYNGISGGPGCVCLSLEALLSVELQSFSAVAMPAGVVLRWTTASETDNARFEILRDGVTVAQLPTQGNGAQGHTYTWTDETAPAGRSCTYTLVSVDLFGAREEVASKSVTPESAGPAAVTEYALHGNYPNPFNPATTIVYDLAEAGEVSLMVFNLLGEKVATLLTGPQAAGRHTVSFDGARLPTGIYLCRLHAGAFVAEQKMLLLK